MPSGVASRGRKGRMSHGQNFESRLLKWASYRDFIGSLRRSQTQLGRDSEPPLRTIGLGVEPPKVQPRIPRSYNGTTNKHSTNTTYSIIYEYQLEIQSRRYQLCGIDPTTGIKALGLAGPLLGLAAVPVRAEAAPAAGREPPAGAAGQILLTINSCMEPHIHIYIYIFIFMHMCIHIYMYIPITAYLFVCWFVCVCLPVSLCLPVCLSVCPSVSLSVSLLIFLSLSLSLSLCLSIYLSIPLPLSLSIFLSFSLSLSIYIYI